MTSADVHRARLAPPPDFRYVGLEVASSPRLGSWLGYLGAGAVVGTALRGAAGAILGVGAVAVAGAATRVVGASRRARDRGRVGMAIVPWGIALEFDDRSRVLLWPAVQRVQVQSVHGRDAGTPTTRYSTVVVDTAHERFVGRASGAVPLDRLTAYLADYARESTHRIALDLDGAVAGEGPTEPDAELVLEAVRVFLATPESARRLGLPSHGYRSGGPRVLGPVGEAELRRVLGDRTARAVDPRPFAVALAAVLGADGLVDELLMLVQSPLPLLAAFAKVAATKLGVARAKVGSLEEVEPFLLVRDVEALAAWQGA